MQLCNIKRCRAATIPMPTHSAAAALAAHMAAAPSCTCAVRARQGKARQGKATCLHRLAEAHLVADDDAAPTPQRKPAAGQRTSQAQQHALPPPPPPPCKPKPFLVYRDRHVDACHGSAPTYSHAPPTCCSRTQSKTHASPMLFQKRAAMRRELGRRGIHVRGFCSLHGICMLPPMQSWLWAG